jgi:Tol biopolymer transport system component
MPTWRRLQILLLVFVSAAALAAQSPARRRLSVDDVSRIRDLRDPQCSPDGKWVAYVVSSIDVKEDKSNTHIWMVSLDGKTDRQVTSSSDSESSPRWSPDGQYLAFTSSRPGPAKGNQVWLLDRSGGEAAQLTDVKGRLQSYEWAPDSKRLVLVVGDPDPDAEPPAAGAGDAAGRGRVPKPIVIDRYKYKQDGQGYLLSGRHSFIYLFDIATKKLERLTKSTFDEAAPSWSPDGTRIAFSSNRHDDPDRDPASQIFVVDAKPGSTEKALTPATTRVGRSARLEWSPDGKWIAFLEAEDKKFGAYSMDHLSIVATDGSRAPSRIAAVDALDRGVSGPQFSTDGTSLTFVVTDDRSAYPARVALAGANVQRLMAPPVVVSSWTLDRDCSAVLSGGDTKPTEVHALEGGVLRPLTHQNDALFADLQIAATQEVSFTSKDGTEVHGLLTTPVGYVAGTRVP